MSDTDRNYRLDKRVILQAAAVYLPTYKKFNDMENFAAAEELLDKYNIGLSVWPPGGGKSSMNSLIVKPYDKPIRDTKEAYKKLREDVNDLIKNRAPGYPFVVPIIFCQFDATGLGITPHSTKVGAASPACLISMSAESMKDKMTILHEMGHAVLYPDPSHNETAGNLMHEADGRTFLFKFQVEAFGHAFFAKYA